MRASVLGPLVFSSLWLSRLALGQAITEFSVPVAPFNIVSGPDGNLWFTEKSERALGRLSTSGVQTQIALAVGSFVIESLVFDADGNLWFTEGNKIGRIAPGGKITEFTIPGAFPSAGGIAFGSDRNIWFTVTLPVIGTQIDRIMSSGGISEFPLSAFPGAITAGPDGNIWFTESGNRIARITPSGNITEFSVPGDNNPFLSYLNNITAGPDGALWFTDNTGKIGRITTSGQVSEFDIPGGLDIPGGQYLAGITSGPDGAVWFTEGSRPPDCAPYFPGGCPPLTPSPRARSAGSL